MTTRAAYKTRLCVPGGTGFQRSARVRGLTVGSGERGSNGGGSAVASPRLGNGGLATAGPASAAREPGGRELDGRAADGREPGGRVRPVPPPNDGMNESLH